MALLGKFLAKMLYPTVFRRAPRTRVCDAKVTSDLSKPTPGGEKGEQVQIPWNSGEGIVDGR